jgi:hypothetical protein
VPYTPPVRIHRRVKGRANGAHRHGIRQSGRTSPEVRDEVHASGRRKHTVTGPRTRHPVEHSPPPAARTASAGPIDLTTHLIPPRHGQPIRFGPDGGYGVVRTEYGGLRAAEVAEVGESALVAHDTTRDDPSYAFALSRLTGPDLAHTPTGAFRAVARPSYDRPTRGRARPTRTDAPRRPGDDSRVLGDGPPAASATLSPAQPIKPPAGHHRPPPKPKIFWRSAVTSYGIA